MIKQVIKERIVPYTQNEIVCDLCEVSIPEDAAMITLTPQIAGVNGEKYNNEAYIEVCSIECLTKNVGAAGLVMNMKVFPNLRTKIKERESKRKTDNDMLNEYAQATKFQPGFKAYFDTCPPSATWQGATSGRATGGYNSSGSNKSS